MSTRTQKYVLVKPYAELSLEFPKPLSGLNYMLTGYLPCWSECLYDLL